MQRNRHEKIGLGQNFTARAGHPSPERFGELHPVVIFQPVHQLPHRAILEISDRPGAGKDRRIGNRLGRQQPVIAKIHGEGRSEPFAKRPLDETHPCPTGSTHRTRCARGLAATEASGRKHRVKSGVREASQNWNGPSGGICQEVR